jgi:cytochrome c biogenesis protein CcmG/thiol:disulfide interchange protein DsbE
MKLRLRFVLPLLALAALAFLLWRGLALNPREVPSPLVGKPAPAFSLPLLETTTGAKVFTPADMRGKVWLLNVWASWCVACREEHPVLVELAKSGVVPIVGLNYKDEPEAARAWLARFGNPYVKSAVDADGKVGIDYGVYGVPETYLIDAEGVIRFKQIGPVTPRIVEERIRPLLAPPKGPAS